MAQSVSLVQGQSLVRRVHLSQPPENVSIDPYSNIYISDKQGNTIQYNAKGDSLRRYAPEQPAKVHLLEAWKGLKILLFYQDLQRYTWLNRFLVNTEVYSLNAEKIGFARLLNYAGDGNIWIFDDQDFSLKKYNPDDREGTIIVRTPCDLILKSKNCDLVFLREYQNQVFLLDKNSGIFIFDNFGNYKKKLEIGSINFITFLQDHLTYLQGNTLYFQHIYTNLQQKIQMPIEHCYKDFFLINTEQIFLFTSTEMHILRYEKKNP